MAVFEIKNLSFTYPKRKTSAISEINLKIKSGEFIVLCGKSGCGKTTLLRLLKPELSPSGSVSGEILYNQEDINCLDSHITSTDIGFVLQNPDSQIVTDKVWHELAFGAESIGMKNGEIRRRVSEMASFFGIQNWFHKKTDELSGGQKQILNLASIMVMQPKVLILDEPTSCLDPIAASEFLKTLKKVNDELGTTIIMSEHRLEEVLPMSDKVVVMENGRILAENHPEKVGRFLYEQNNCMFEAMPTPMRVFCSVDNKNTLPLTVKDGRSRLYEYTNGEVINEDLITNKTEQAFGECVIDVKGASFRYSKDSPDVVKNLNLKVRKGEFYALLGGNGTGKTTALSLISGLNKPQRGTIKINGCDISKTDKLYEGLLGVMPQSPQELFAKKTVFLELMDMTDKKQSLNERKARVEEVAKICEIDNLTDSHPYDLSGGEQQRTALAMILLKNPQILILDEPTKGLDSHFKKTFADILLKLKKAGTTILMVSHDIEFCAEYADRCALFFDGSITSEGEAREFFCGNSFYTTSANRMARGIIPKAVLAEDIICALGGELQKLETKAIKEIFFKEENSTEDNKTLAVQQTKQNADKKSILRNWLTAGLLLIIIPLTILFGVYCLDDRKYYFVSLLIICETLVPFMALFEKRKPKAREVVVISSLCAIAVAGRAAFFMLPQVKPVAAIVIIAGICLGSETGFLVGCVTAFVSNFIFGQGPWTPWQMFAFGIIGFLAGILFKKNFLPKKRIWISIFGFVVTFVLYGLIMNTASVMMMSAVPNIQALISAVAMGIPMDLLHGVSTAVILFLIAEPMIEKLERIKIKYGLI